jgi:hypothetical protein
MCRWRRLMSKPLRVNSRGGPPSRIARTRKPSCLNLEQPGVAVEGRADSLNNLQQKTVKRKHLVMFPQVPNLPVA